MHRPEIPKPTTAELEILKVLWARGPRTVREVHDALATTQVTGYTTVLKLMQIMTEKGLVRRDESQRAHVYSAALSEKKTQRKIVGDVLDRLFDGNAAQLVMHALSTRRASSEELAEIRNLLDSLEGESR